MILHIFVVHSSGVVPALCKELCNADATQTGPARNCARLQKPPGFVTAPGVTWHACTPALRLGLTARRMLQEYLAAGDAKETEEGLRALAVPFFYHELVRQVRALCSRSSMLLAVVVHTGERGVWPDVHCAVHMHWSNCTP